MLLSAHGSEETEHGAIGAGVEYVHAFGGNLYIILLAMHHNKYNVISFADTGVPVLIYDRRSCPPLLPGSQTLPKIAVRPNVVASWE